MNDFWKCADGRQIKYVDLEDSHLKNLISDGYRNPKIEEEAEKRGFEIPEREVDKMSDEDIIKWIDSFASCAISGNPFAEKMMGFWRTEPRLFFFFLNQVLERNKTLNNTEQGDMNELA